MQISWKHIRALNGSQTEGFEEFVTQLGRRESPETAKFTRKGKPDAGLECFCVLKDGDEWGWQAKFFSTMGSSQWQQLDDSVHTALEKHPRLVRYYVCVPLDLADPRLPGQMSAADRWNGRLEKWTIWARERQRAIEFIWWGGHEMLERLMRTDSAGLARFWFDAAILDDVWLRNRLDESIRTAGPRYTPEVNVDLPIAQEFDAFGRTERWVKRTKAFAVGISKTVRTAQGAIWDLGDDASSSQTVLRSAELLIVGLREITVEPTGPVSFDHLLETIKATRSLLESAVRELYEKETQEDAKPRNENESHRQNRFRSPRFHMHDLDTLLDQIMMALKHTQELARTSFVILNGSAGMGKTHLLCDLSVKRLDQGLPTVLLMGQRFLQPGEPWSQALQLLDLSKLSAEEFVGALEAAAQVANARALLIIDALNEGAGRSIWLSHLSAFLALAKRSPWISVVVSARTSYEELVVPEELSEETPHLEHSGFADHEYDASKKFFAYYGIELPSTPLLAPEYRSPLFLRTICVGLRDSGHTRLPRGFHGISQVFKLYTDAINKKLALALDFDPRSQLVKKALDAVVSAFPVHSEQWLTRAKAVAIVDGLLPNRNFQMSLYQGLVGEGLLVEDIYQFGEDDEENEFVQIGYERLADHLTAALLIADIQKREPREDLTHGSITDNDNHLSAGVLESLFIQAPETLKHELMELASSITDHQQWQTAYRQSLIWRDPSAFGEKTLEWFNRSLRGESDAPDTLEVLLTLASVPEHPWNATFLDSRLRKHSMPERDSRWTIPLHSLYASRQSAVHRLIDWGLTIKRGDQFDSDSILRIAIALAWMFSSSNRYLRDRATKANANLLAGRESIAAELVRHFAEVNDLYVRERVLAVAYGVVMRSQDVDGVKLIADAVLDTVFATGDVVPHILLRDYARGVIERVNVLSPFPLETLKRVRPPYGSKWPRIPSKATIEKLESSYRANKRFGAGRIFSSVLHDDFGRYVIGTNSWSTDWLSLRLSQPEWRSYDAQISEIEQDLGPDERLLWDEWREAEKQLNDLSTPYIFKVLGRSMAEHEGEYPSNDELADSVASATRIVEQTRNSLARVLKQSVARKLEELWKTGRSQGNRAPKFDLHLIQRYVAKRVFDLGWTSERFDYFDSHVIGYGGREASKAERIGKKYQWIAYHEACALVADNFQYRPRSGRSEQNIPYEGPWQDSFRDIDPSHSIDRTGENAEDSAAWWTPSLEVDWGEGEDGQAWAEKTGDFPNPNDLLEVTDGDGKAWVLGDLSFERSRPVPDGLNSEEIESRKIWCNLTGFLVHTEDVGKFMEWAEGVDFWGRWMPESPSSHGMFLGEYLWSPASAYFEDEYYENGGWVTPDNECPVSIRPAAFVYHQASRGFDCSVESGFNLDLPSEDIVKTLSIQWTGHGSDFESVEGDLATMDPSANADGPSCLLIRRHQVDRLVEEGKLAMCWTILGEKQAYDFSAMEHRGSIHISGACTAQGAQVRGFMHFIRDRIDEREIEYKLETRRFSSITG